MKKFNIKKMYGYYWMIISLVIQLLIFILLLCLTFYLKSFDLSKASNKEGANEVIIALIVLDIICAISFLGSSTIYLCRFLPFKNADGEIVTVKITKRNFFSTMHGEILTINSNNIVKIRFVSRTFINYFAAYNIGDCVDCFIKKKDLSNPKTVILYR